MKNSNPNKKTTKKDEIFKLDISFQELAKKSVTTKPKSKGKHSK